MATQVDKMNIYHIRRDTLKVNFIFPDAVAKDDPYQLQANDTVVFTMRESYDGEVLLQKTLPHTYRPDGTSAVNLIVPANEMNFEAGNYVYDVQLTLADGTVSTMRGKIKIYDDVTYS